MPSRRPGPSQTSTQESTTQGDEEQRFAEVRMILMEYLLFYLTILLRFYCPFLSEIFPLSIIFSC